MKFNLYDFDHTIYNGDATFDFYCFLLSKFPRLIFLIPYTVFVFLKYLTGHCSKIYFKEIFYRFIRIPDIDFYVNEFWKDNKIKIKEWYLRKQQPNDVIISASPEFLLKVICKEIGIKTLIASRIDKLTGEAISNNCYGEEKLIMLKQVMPQFQIMEFYSDSYSDEPLAALAEQAYKVKGNKIKSWYK
jgi:hypothetical protein